MYTCLLSKFGSNAATVRPARNAGRVRSVPSLTPTSTTMPLPRRLPGRIKGERSSGWRSKGAKL
eukprot:3693314-Prymnesium_polylepis.2